MNDNTVDLNIEIFGQAVNKSNPKGFLNYSIVGENYTESKHLINHFLNPAIYNPRFDFDVINSASKFEKPNSTIRLRNIATPSVIKIYTSDGSANHIYKIFVR